MFQIYIVVMKELVLVVEKLYSAFFSQTHLFCSGSHANILFAVVTSDNVCNDLYNEEGEKSIYVWELNQTSNSESTIFSFLEKTADDIGDCLPDFGKSHLPFLHKFHMYVVLI